MIETAYGYGYRKVGFILDRGYFSKSNLDDIDAQGYSFVIMVRGKADFVNAIVREKKRTFEKKMMNYIDEFDLYGTTVATKLYATQFQFAEEKTTVIDDEISLCGYFCIVTSEKMTARNRIYTCLRKKMKDMDKRPDYMTVPAALKELEKIEMIRHTDNIYRMDHPVTKTQKEILSAFGIDAANVKYRAEEIGKMLSERGKHIWQG